MTFWILLALAGLVSYFSLRHRNLLLSLGASIMWLSLMAYNLTYPPTNITAGDTIHEWMTMGFVIIAIAVMYMWFRNRGRTESMTRVSAGEGEILARSATQEGVTPTRSVMALSPEEYKAHLRSRMRRRRR